MFNKAKGSWIQLFQAIEGEGGRQRKKEIDVCKRLEGVRKLEKEEEKKRKKRPKLCGAEEEEKEEEEE